ncbi:MAG: hypothetical protein JWN28_584 [Candidatus Saccharibacteria bacterium]|nr:hypothetical protein [Candidatus Saccharibacteria bacterium]
MKMKETAFAAIVASALVLSGCTASSLPDHKPSETSTSSPSSTDSESKPAALNVAEDASLLPKFATEAGSGANAGPTAPGATTSTGIYDSSQAAHDNFYAWWRYEAVAAQDGRLSFEKIVYPMGAIACGRIAAGSSPEMTATHLDKNYAVTGSGAQGVVVGALNALCPRYNTGYQSFFDQNAQAYVEAVAERYTLNPPHAVFDYGWFMKETCAYLATSTRAGATLYNHMVHLSTLGGFFADVARADIGPDVPRVMIKLAVYSGCFGYSHMLPPVIANS